MCKLNETRSIFLSPAWIQCISNCRESFSKRPNKKRFEIIIITNNNKNRNKILNFSYYSKLLKNLEAELLTQTTIKNEQEAALKLLESSLNDKHEIINILREQLEQVKSINLDFVNDSQKNEMELKRLNKELDETKTNLDRANALNLELEKK